MVYTVKPGRCDVIFVLLHIAQFLWFVYKFWRYNNVGSVLPISLATPNIFVGKYTCPLSVQLWLYVENTTLKIHMLEQCSGALLVHTEQIRRHCHAPHYIPTHTQSHHIYRSRRRFVPSTRSRRIGSQWFTSFNQLTPSRQHTAPHTHSHTYTHSHTSRVKPAESDVEESHPHASTICINNTQRQRSTASQFSPLHTSYATFLEPIVSASRARCVCVCASVCVCVCVVHKFEASCVLPRISHPSVSI